MKVMHLIVGLDTGGAERMMCKLVKQMHWHTHIIVSLTSLGSMGQELIDTGHSVYALDLRLTKSWRAIRQFWSLIQQYHPDVIQTWMYHSDLIGGLIGRLSGHRNIVWNVRNTQIPQRKLSTTSFVIKLCALLSRVLPHAIVCCAQAGLKSHAALGYDKRRMFVIPNGYDVNVWKPLLRSKSDFRLDFGLPLNAFIVGIVGRFDPLKDYENFVEAAGIVASKISRSCVFLMVGRNVDASNPNLALMIDRKGSQAAFHLMGERKDVPEIMSTLDLYCLSSKAEGFPNVVAEAMLMEVPCVVTDVGDAALIVGSTGRVVPPSQPIALAEAILEFANMGSIQRQDMGRAARQRVIDNFAMEGVVERYQSLYEVKVQR